MKREQRIQRTILEWVKTQGYGVKVNSGDGTPRGTSDLFACIFGIMVVTEVKIPGEDATPKQLHELYKWGQAGAVIGVVHSLDEYKTLLRVRGIPRKKVK